ncbi:HET-domain-containing protein [Dendrothele bispora CBS 962.96]|uniref:HET-domain-containing protein n=1 Tax=Dendrothele bispora (strain CBS 962.96) TaxID=1314807 RepID=A0A4S8LM60_DENBC|nr:HET-domain-containing protein [Dendrothele bispora CBS 962.96]
MRLLSTSTLTLTEFYTVIPPYAILSHTWGEQEVTFQDIQTPKEARKKKEGYAKLQGACAHARRYQFDYIWIDTCCIDKESSTELSEALNSMYKYYQGGQVCYAYLSDVKYCEDPNPIGSSFRRSKWFTRGWTLQELLAPPVVVFLGEEWKEIGSKSSLRSLITAITGIPSRVLLSSDYRNISIAQKMSWAAWRNTKRIEDRAYSLMGLFGVNMPPIYGEGGEKAFLRLQQEIIRSSSDRSIFAWSVQSNEHEECNGRGLLARSPSDFRASGEVGISDIGEVDERTSYSMTNNGLHIHLPFRNSGDHSDLHQAYLHCRSEKTGECVYIWLQKQCGQQYVRCKANELVLKQTEIPLDEMREIFVKDVESTIRNITDVSPSVTPSQYIIKKLPSSCNFNCDRLLFRTDHPSHCYYPQELPTKDGWMISTREDLTNDGLALKFRTDHQEAFIVLIGVKDGVVFSNIVTGPDCATSERITGPYYCYGGEDCRYRDRDLKQLRHGGAVQMILQNTPHPRTKIIELSIIVDDKGLPTTSLMKDSQSPDFGFMIDVGICKQLDVYPTDFFMNPGQWGSRSFISIDLNERRPCRLMIFQISDLEFTKFGVVFGIDGSEAWISTFKVSSLLPDSFPNILKWHYDHKVPGTEQKLVIEDEGNPREEYCVTVSIGRRKVVQVGSHWSRIQVEKIDRTAIQNCI